MTIDKSKAEEIADEVILQRDFYIRDLLIKAAEMGLQEGWRLAMLPKNEISEKEN